MRFRGARFSEVCVDQGVPSSWCVPPPGAPHSAPSSRSLPGPPRTGTWGSPLGFQCGCVWRGRQGSGWQSWVGAGPVGGAEVVPPQACPQERVWGSRGPSLWSLNVLRLRRGQDSHVAEAGPEAAGALGLTVSLCDLGQPGTSPLGLSRLWWKKAQWPRM